MPAPFSIYVGLAKGWEEWRCSQEIENSRRAGFSLLRYANKASEQDSETELLNQILISQEISFWPDNIYVYYSGDKLLSTN